MSLQPTRDGGATLAGLIDRVLERGLVINADIQVSVAGTELLGLKIRAALASFETAARYGLEFPLGTSYNTPAWQEAQVERESCPGCGKRGAVDQLLEDGCPWCGWRSARALQREIGIAAEGASLTS